jgi:hypothetical protein
VEIEAKYAISDPAVFDTLVDLRAVGRYTLRHGRGEVVDHLDTADRDLLKAGCVPFREQGGTVNGS